MQNNSIKKPLVEVSNNTGKTQAFSNFWNKLPGSSKQKIVTVFCDLAKDIKNSEAAQSLFSKVLSINVIKDTLANRMLTDKDKDTLARKLNINRTLLDGVDNFLELIGVVAKVSPVAVGLIWDALEIGPLDELIFGGGAAALDGPVPAGDVVGLILAIIQTVLSFVPDKTIIAALVTAGVFFTGVVFRIFKNLAIYNIIPEAKEAKELESAFNGERPEELTEGFAAEFKLYEHLWD
jgi:hypothetical protein